MAVAFKLPPFCSTTFEGSGSQSESASASVRPVGAVVRPSVRHAANTGERIERSGHIECNTDALRREPHVLSGRDRRIIEVRPEMIAHDVTDTGGQQFGNEPEGAQHRSQALAA